MAKLNPFVLCATIVLFTTITTIPTIAQAPVGFDGHISRTFLQQGSVDWKIPDGSQIGGAGWYDPDDPNNLCLLRIMGLTIGGNVYYETLRMTTNQPHVYVTTIPRTFSNIGCPSGNNAELGTSEANVFLSTQVGQSHVLCFDTFDPCAYMPSTAKWHLYVCQTLGSVSFTPGSLLPVVTITQGSQQINGCSDPGDPVRSYDVSSFLNPELGNQRSFANPLGQLSVQQIVPPGDPSSYVVSCYSIEYNKLGNSFLAETHDWFLVLTDVSPLTALAVHFDNNAQGFYDLSGDNGCPFDMTEPLEEIVPKAKNAPLI